jgi:hypothetical protein
MALVIKDRVKETTTTTGTGTYTLAGAEVGFQSFSTIGNGNTTYYAVTNNNDWEVGIGTYTSSGTTLARTTILSSSNSNNAVNWSSGEKYVIVTQPSSKASFLDASGDLNLSGDIVVSGTVDGRNLSADGTKVDYISVTQAVNLDEMETDIAALANGMVYKGDWDASSGSFPSGAQTGWFYYVSVEGTVNSIAFHVGDNLVATTDNASTSTYASNWSKHDQTDAVQAVVGLTGSISKSGLLSALNVEDGADVTDATNVTAAGALMDSEVTNLAQVKAFDSSDYATAAQGTTADAALPKAGGAMTGAITTNSTFDGRDVATDGTKLDGIEASADVTDTANVTSAGALMDSEVTNLAQVKAFDTSDYATAAQGTKADAALPKAGGAITGNVTWGDNSKAIFGAGSDLQIYHDSSTNKSHITESGSSHLIIQGQEIQFKNASGVGLMDLNSAQVELRYSGTKKMETNSAGITVTGNVAVTGTVDGVDIATNIPASLGTAGQVLTVNSGASAGEWADAGGGADLYAANESSPTAQPSATGANAIAIGDSVVSSGNGSLGAGFGATASGSKSIALGQNSVASSVRSVAISNSHASGWNATAINIDTNSTSYGATGSGSVSMGQNAKSSGSESFVLGRDSISSHTRSFALGYGITSTANNQVNIGGDTQDVRISETYTLPKVDGSANQVLTTDGSGAVSWATAGGGGADLFAENYDGTSTAPSATGTNTIAIGIGASSTATRGFAVLGSVSSGEDGIAMGKTSSATGNYPIAIGYGASAGTRGVSIGQSTTTTGQGSVAIGQTVYANPSSGDGAVGLGYLTYATANRSFANSSSRASGDSSIALGITNNTTSYGASGANSIAMGLQASAEGGIALGSYSSSTSGTSVAIGNSASTSIYGNAVAIGRQATSTSSFQITLGHTHTDVKISSAYTLPKVDGSANQVLTTNGSGAVSWAAAGGGGADLYAANESSPSAQPSATGTNAIAIGDSAISTNTNSFAGPLSRAEGTNSFAMGINNNTTSYGTNSNSTNAISIGARSKTTNSSTTAVGEYAWATHGEGAAFGYLARATSNYALALGARSTSSSTATVALSFESSATAYGSVAIGIGSKSTSNRSVAFSDSRASGASSFAAQITNNTSSYGATGANSIAIGMVAKATAGNAVAIGSRATASSTSSMSFCTSYANYGNVSSAANAITMGDGNSASATSSIATGYAANANVQGKHAHANGSFGGGNAEGSAQRGTFVLRCDTTDATAEALRTSSGTASTDNQIVLPNNSCYGFTGTVIAREAASATNDFAVWEIKGGAVRAASASTTALGTYNINKISESSGATNWSIALSADTTNGAVAITVTGEASHNIRWVATVNTTEVTY